jgi:formate dehydrogenase assembly factor FdhD
VLAVYSIITLASIVCAGVDCWEFAVGFALAALLIVFRREARRMLCRASRI